MAKHTLLCYRRCYTACLLPPALQAEEKLAVLVLDKGRELRSTCHRGRCWALLWAAPGLPAVSAHTPQDACGCFPPARPRALLVLPIKGPPLASATLTGPWPSGALPPAAPRRPLRNVTAAATGTLPGFPATLSSEEPPPLARLALQGLPPTGLDVGQKELSLKQGQWLRPQPAEGQAVKVSLNKSLDKPGWGLCRPQTARASPAAWEGTLALRPTADG